MRAIILASAAGLVVIGAVLATQFIAAAFGAQAALGGPLFVVADISFYRPWAIWAWTEQWGDDYPQHFAIARLIVLLSVVAGALVAAIARLDRPALRPFGKDAWAKPHDLLAAGLFAAQGTILGKVGGEIIAFDGPEHQLLIGASRSGKGRGHVVPTLLAWPRSALVFDVKGELDSGDSRHGFPGTSGFRAGLGPVLRFAPTRLASNAFNPLFEVRRGVNEIRDVQNIIEIVVDPAGDARRQDFWDRSAKQILVGVILHVLYCEPVERKTLAAVREKLRDLDRTADEMRTTLHRLNPRSNAPEVHPEVLHAAESYLAGEERLRSNVKATAESFFGIFADPIVAEKTARSDFRVGDLMCGDKPVTLYLQPPPSDAARLMPLLRLVLNQVARGLMEDQTKDAQGRIKTHPLLLLLDEFPQLGAMPFFEAAMGAMAGYGIKVYLVCQSLNHVARAYGRDGVILDNCRVVTAFAGADMGTAKRIAEMAGEVWEMRPQESEQRPRALLGPRKGAITYREERRPLLLAGDVRSLPHDEQLVFVSGCKPLKAKKLRFDREPIFVRRLRPPAPQQAALTCAHDWHDVCALGRLQKEKKPVTLARAARPLRPSAQEDLFEGPPTPAPAPKVSDRALAAFRHPDGSPLTEPPPARSKGI